MRISIGHKFIFGFLAVVSAAAFAPDIIEKTEVAEWLKAPLGFLAAMVIGLILGSFFTRTFTRHFNRLTQLAKRISLGDLSDSEDLKKTRKAFPDETTELEEALLLMFGNLKTLVGHLKDTVEKLAAAEESLKSIIEKGYATSGEVVAGTNQIFDGALTQARHMEDTSKMVKEVQQLADDVAIKIMDTVNASDKTNSMIQRGANTATGAIEKMEIVFKGIEKNESAILKLKGKLSNIPKVLDVITHISRQTDLLALNATIEASKAGEYGRGFAMVAEEVRRLADNSRKSAEEVSSIVKELTMEAERVMETANEGTSSVKEGRGDIRKIRDIFSEITDYTSDVSGKGNLILALTQKQKARSEAMVKTIEEVSRIARENLEATEAVDKAVEKHGSSVEETLAASRNLSELSQELKSVMKKFNAT